MRQLERKWKRERKALFRRKTQQVYHEHLKTVKGRASNSYARNTDIYWGWTRQTGTSLRDVNSIQDFKGGKNR